jgi:hypothetical protein
MAVAARGEPPQARPRGPLEFPLLGAGLHLGVTMRLRGQPGRGRKDAGPRPRRGPALPGAAGRGGFGRVADRPLGHLDPPPEQVAAAEEHKSRTATARLTKRLARKVATSLRGSPASSTTPLVIPP